MNRPFTTRSGASGSKRLAHALLLSLVLGVTAKVTRNAMSHGWKQATDRPPPIDDDHADLRDAIGWAVLSGVVAGLARLAVRRTLARQLARRAAS